MPAFNEATTIERVIKSIPTKFMDVDTVELLVINDGSYDETEKIARSNGAIVVTHNYNKGVGSAFQTAVDYALRFQADILLSIDADGQFDVIQIGDMIRPILNKTADFCIGNRFWNSRPMHMPKIKFWGNKKISKIVSFVGNVKIYDASCGFRAYSRDCLLNLNLQGQFTYTHESILDLLDKGFKVEQVPINVAYFDERVSRIANSLGHYALRTSLIIFKCLKDYKPLRFFLSIAFIVLFIGFSIGGFVLWHWLDTGMISPYKSFGFIALALCGMAVFIATLAFVADMLNRIRANQEKILFLLKKKYFEKD